MSGCQSFSGESKLREFEIANFDGLDATLGGGHVALRSDGREDEGILLIPLETSVFPAPIWRKTATSDEPETLAMIPARMALDCVGRDEAIFRDRFVVAGTGRLVVALRDGTVREVAEPGSFDLHCDPSPSSTELPVRSDEPLLSRRVSSEFGRLLAYRGKNRLGLELVRQSPGGELTRFDPGAANESVVSRVDVRALRGTDSLIVQTSDPAREFFGILSSNGWQRDIAKLKDGPWYEMDRFPGAPRPLLQILHIDPLVVTNSLGYVFIEQRDGILEIEAPSSNARVSSDGKEVLIVRVDRTGVRDEGKDGVAAQITVLSVPLS